MNRASHSLFPVLAQVMLLVAGVSAIGLMPPAEGMMIAVRLPLTGQDGLAARAVAAGGLIAGRGPLPGSILLRGRRAALAGPMLAAGILLIAAPWGGCGRQGPDA